MVLKSTPEERKLAAELLKTGRFKSWSAAVRAVRTMLALEGE